MIEAIVEAAKEKKGAELPQRLILALWCNKYRTLPGPGSIFEQDYREMYLNDVLPRIYDAVRAWRTHGGNLSASDLAVITWLAKIGAM